MDETTGTHSLRAWLGENFQELALLAVGLLVLALIGAAIVIRY